MIEERGAGAAELREAAKRLESTRVGAEYWLKGAREEPDKGLAIMSAESAINHWKNAAYAMSDQVVDLERRLLAAEARVRELEGEVAQLEKNINEMAEQGSGS